MCIDLSETCFITFCFYDWSTYSLLAGRVTLEALVCLVKAFYSGTSLSKLRTDFDSLMPLSDATWDG